MKEKVPAFIEKWGQSVIILLSALMIASSLQASSSNLRTERAIVRFDKNMEALWTGVRLGNASKLPAEPPVRPDYP